MSRKTDQTSLTPLIVRSTAIALIAAAMPLGLDISSDGDVSFGAPVAHAKRGGISESGNDRGSNGSGTGSTPNVPGPSTSEAVDVFSGSAEPIGPDLTENEEQDLISRGWQ